MFLFPLLTMLASSFKSTPEIGHTPPTLLPKTWTDVHWRALFSRSSGVLPGITNSILVGLATAVLAMAVSVLAGLGLGRFRFRGAGLVFGVILMGMMIPFTVLLTPLVVVMRKAGLDNSLVGLVLVYAVYQLPFCVFVMRNAFAAIPRELEEAAYIDGCSRRSVVIRIFLPLVTPGIVTCMIFAFLNAWNEFLVALVLLSEQAKFTLPVLLLNIEMGRFGNIDWGILDAGIVASMVPCLLIFFLLQRYYVSGIFSGVSK